MKLLSLVILLMLGLASYGQVVIPDEAQIDPKAELKIYSTDKGVLLPRIAGLDMLSIKEPATGLWIFNTSNTGFYFFDATSWNQIEKTRTDPVTATYYDGEMYFDESADKIKYWNGSAWITIGTL